MVTISSYQNLLRFDAAPTEVQMKLGISQVLSMPFAYNSPVIVLDFEVGNKNIIKGRFKDAIRSRVFEFEIGDSITFKPFTWKRTDSLGVDPVAWEDFSKGYSYRYDAVKTPRKEKPKCGNTSYNCGKACIGLNKNCKSDPPDKPSQEKVDKLRAAAGEFKAVQDDPTKKQEDNKLTPKPPVSAPKQAPNSAVDKAKQNPQPKPDADVSDSDKRSFESLYTTKLSSAQQLLNLEKNAKIAQISPSEDQKNYDKKQPDLNIDSGPGIMEGWRTVKPDGSVQGIPWSVKAEGQEKSRVIVGARLTDHPASPNLKRLRLYDADRRNETIDFKKGDRNASLRARRLVKEIAQGKSQEMESGDIKALIEGGNAGLAKRKVEKARLAAEDKQFKAALDDYLKSKNLTRESIKGLTDIGMDDLIEKVEKYQKSQSQTPNSTGVKGAGGKTVDQQYKDIVASSKDPKGTEEAIAEALAGTLDYKKQTYERYLAAQTSGTVPPGYEKHYQEHIDQYKPVIEAEQFFNERRQKAVNGDFETEAEVMAYMGSLKGKYKNSYEFYDSPEYTEKRSKIESIIKNNYELPPPLSGNIPRSELKKTLSPGDKLLVKENTYGYAGSSGSSNIPTEYNVREGGEVTKVAITNVMAKKQYSGQQNAFESKTPMKDITHIIRDGKRYKVDDSDSSPNDLKPEKTPKAKVNKTPKQKATKQKAINIQPQRSQKQESPLIPKEEIVKDAPKRIGDGTHEGAPKNAQEYYDAAVKTGKAMTMKEAEDTVAAVSGWSRSSNDIRNDQKKGKFNKKAELISDYVRNSTPYNGDIHRGIVFNNREEAMEWIKGDENGVLDNQNAHASWTSKESVAWVYTNPMMRKANKTLAGVIVSSVNKTGASIEKLSRYKESEAEVLVAKDARHKVKSVTEKDGILYVQTEEI